MLMSAFFKDIFQQNVHTSFKKVFLWNMLLLYNSSILIVALLCNNNIYNVAFYILVQTEEYSLFAKQNLILTKLNGKTIDQKGKKLLNNEPLWCCHSLDDVIYHQFHIINVSVTL